ncbi:MAG TPA: DUF3857 domain-containing protein, partial [Candidatus Acidoferrum sp.]|nr:DUF3857 domain-containing protein [Candidatus Acidoferrum sp.]
MTDTGVFLSRIAAALAALVLVCGATPAQQAKPPGRDAKPALSDKNAAQIELLETSYRFESNGDSRKEVHARVRINNELGARQFARLNFDFNRSYQSVEIPLVRVTHASGGTADTLPGAITDIPNPAVADFPAYSDIRVKSVRILGLQPEDLLEYRVVTTTAHHPLAPDFWLDHTFDRSGVVSQEIFQLDLPAELRIIPKINPQTPAESPLPAAPGSPRQLFRWNRKSSVRAAGSENPAENGPDIALSTFKSWDRLAEQFAKLLLPAADEGAAMREEARKISERSAGGATEELYDFVSQKLKTVDVSLDATGYRTRRPREILQSGYATAEDKFILFAAMRGATEAGFVFEPAGFAGKEVPSPARFAYLLTLGQEAGRSYWLDLNSEVAPIGMLPAEFHGKLLFVIGEDVRDHWQSLKSQANRPSSQKVSVNAVFDADGTLRAKVRYSMRGENELPLRVAFHKTEKDKWKDVAQMLALSDGFRGQILNVTASDPYATREPFSVEYEISQAKFVDWSKKPVRIPPILPLPGLPDAPAAAQIEAKKSIELGTPLAIDLEATIELPAGATARAPVGTTVDRDYATFTSKYSVQGSFLRASRSLHF